MSEPKYITTVAILGKFRNLPTGTGKRNHQKRCEACVRSIREDLPRLNPDLLSEGFIRNYYAKVYNISASNKNPKRIRQQAINALLKLNLEAARQQENYNKPQNSTPTNGLSAILQMFNFSPEEQKDIRHFVVSNETFAKNLRQIKEYAEANKENKRLNLLQIN